MSIPGPVPNLSPDSGTFVAFRQGHSAFRACLPSNESCSGRATTRERRAHVLDAGLDHVDLTAKDLRHIEMSVLSGAFGEITHGLDLSLPVAKKVFDAALSGESLGCRQFLRGDLMTTAAME